MTHREPSRVGAALWMALDRAHRSVLKLYKPSSFDGFPRSQLEFLVLLTIADSGKLRVGEIAALTGATKSGCSRIIDRLAEQGLVVKRKSASDRRHVYATVTRTGEQHAEEFRSIFVGGLDKALPFIFSDDLEVLQLVQLLQRLNRSILTED